MKQIVKFLTFILFISNPPHLLAQSWSCFNENGMPKVTSLIEFNNELYIGTKSYPPPVYMVRKWNGANLESIGVFDDEGNIEILWDFEVYKDELYVCGKFVTVDGDSIKGIAKWNGSNWSSLFDYSSSNIDQIVGMCVYKDELYVGGTIYTLNGDSMHHVAKWNGSAWSTVGYGFDREVTSFAVYRDTLYAGGYFKSSAGANDTLNKIARWYDDNWHPLKNGLSDYTNALVRNMIVYHDTLFVGGGFITNINGYDYLNMVKWYNNEWYPFYNFSQNVAVFSIYNDDLFIGGEFTSVNLDTYIYLKRIARWDGFKIDSLTSGLSSAVYALQPFLGSLYVAGGFWIAGEDTCGGLAIWNMPTSINETADEMKTVQLYPNPFTNSVTIRIKNGSDKNYTLSLYDLSGRKLRQEELRMSDSEYLLNKDDLDAGMYFFEVKERENIIGIGKVIIN